MVSFSFLVFLVPGEHKVIEGDGPRRREVVNRKPGIAIHGNAEERGRGS